MNRKLIVLLVAFLALAPLAARNPVGTVQKTLKLDEDQAQQLSEVLEIWRAQIAPLQSELRDLKGQLKELSQDPALANANAIGVIYLRRQELRQLIKEDEKNFKLEFEGMLSDEQLRIYTRLRKWTRKTARYEKGISALKELGLLKK